MKKQLTLDDVIALLKKRCEEAGSQRAFAIDSEISPQYITDVLRGKREPGAMILEALRLEKVIFYREKE